MTKEPNANNLRTLEFLRDYIIRSGFSKNTDEKTIGYFLCEFDKVWEGDYEDHRWWTEINRVAYCFWVG
jgi:hypothetical protein